MKTKLKKLGLDSIIYGTGAVAARGIAFFLLPILTRLFTPSEYGTIEMLMVITNFVAVFLTLGMEASQSYYFFEQKEKNVQARIVTSIIQWRLLWGTFIVIVATLSAPLLNNLFFNGQLSLEIFAIAFCCGLFIQLMYQGAEVFRFLYRPLPYVLLTLGNAIISGGTAVLLVYFFNLGITGYFIGILVGAVVSVAFSWWGMRQYLDWSSWHRGLWPKLIKFGLPLVPSAISTYFLFTSDRWFISYYLTPYHVGIYAVGAKFALITNLVIQTFMKAFMPFSLEQLHSDNRAQSDEVFKVAFRYYSGFFLALIVILTLISPYVIKIASPEFHDSYRIIGILSLSSIFFGGTYFSRLGFWKAKKTYFYSLSTLIACMVVVLLNMLLVPRYGIIGAAIATATAMFTLVSCSFYFSQKVWKIKFNFTTTFIQLLFCIFSILIILHSYSEEISNIAKSLLTAIVATTAILFITIKEDKLTNLRFVEMVKKMHL